MESQVDKDGSIKKSKNESQYSGLDPKPAHGGENGTRTKTTTGLPEGSKGKEFKGR
jgi:hypothetical protein